MRKLLIVLSILFGVAGCASPGTWDSRTDSSRVDTSETDHSQVGTPEDFDVYRDGGL